MLRRWHLESLVAVDVILAVWAVVVHVLAAVGQERDDAATKTAAGGGGRRERESDSWTWKTNTGLVWIAGHNCI